MRKIISQKTLFMRNIVLYKDKILSKERLYDTLF